MEDRIVMATSASGDRMLEHQLESLGQLTIRQAESLCVENQRDYEQAGRFLIEIKARAKQAKDYWVQPKAAAKLAHQSIVDREKAILAPLAEAERIVKEKMVQHQAALDRARRQAEEEARKRQQEETERLLQRALDAQDAGNEMEATVNLAMAEMVDQMTAQLPMEAPKAEGVNVIKTWKARVIDEKAVPAYMGGVMLRKIDLSALNSIARMTKGTADIPGVEFYQDMSISARG